MLGQAARGLLSPSALFGTREQANKSKGESKQSEQSDPSSKQKSKSKALRLKWTGDKRKTTRTQLDGATPTSGHSMTYETNSNMRTASSSDKLKQANSTSSSSLSERRPKGHQQRRQKQSSPSADLSSGYLSQTNGFAASLKTQAENNADDDEEADNDTNNNENMLYIMKGVHSGKNKHNIERYQYSIDANLGQQAQLHHSNSFASTTLTRLPMVPMMIDDEEGDDEQLRELELNAESDDGDIDFDLERHHQSYQLMIDGLKLRQQQQRHRQHHQQRPRCQQDDKLSLMMRHETAGDIIKHRHLGLAAECADSDFASSPDLPQLYRTDGGGRGGGGHRLAYAHSSPQQKSTTFAEYNSQLPDYNPHEDGAIDDEGLLAAASLNLKSRTLRSRETSAGSTFNRNDPDQRRPAIVYYQPDGPINSEYYARLGVDNNHLHQYLQQQGQNSFIHDHQRRRQKFTSTTSVKNQPIRDHPRLPAKTTGPPPPPRDQHIRGQIHQFGQAKPNLASPSVNKYRHQEDALPVSQIDFVHQTGRAMLANAQTVNSRQHLTSRDYNSNHQQHIKRVKSNNQFHQISPSASDKQQRQLVGTRSAPKSISTGRLDLNESAMSTQEAVKISASLHAISNDGGRGPDFDKSTDMGCCGKLAKFLLFIANILFWCAGVALGAWGILALVEDHKYNLSQLLVFEPSSRMSLFQLLAWSFITLGGATILIGICGCSAMFKNSRWILGLYIFLILAIFALDLATGLLAIIFQERLVTNVRLRLVSKLRNEYGIQASFTAAIDYIQTRYECCGLDGHFDYEQSLWRLQRLGGFEATVARTCCHLRNTLDDQAHVNPRPVNESMCQSTDVRFHQSYRFRRGCLDDLERLIRHKIWTFTIGCGIVGAIILLVLALATCFCRSIPDDGQDSNNNQQPNSSSRKNTSNRVHRQALMYAENVAKKQGSQHQYQHHGHHGHHSITSARHK